MKKKEKEGHDKNIVYSNYDEECCGSVQRRRKTNKRMDESIVCYPARFLSNCQRIAKNGTATADETYRIKVTAKPHLLSARKQENCIY